MKKPILYIVLLLSTNFLFAQGSLIFDPLVPNVTDGIVDFTFDLVGGGAEYDLSVEVSFDGGSVTPTFYPIPPQDIITGALNNVAPASGIALQWDVLASFPGQVTNETLLRVTARHVCGTDFTFTYRDVQVTYGSVSKTYTIDGADVTLCWLDRNLGATQVATSSTDADAYGDLFQWGRGDDGHQVVTWTSSTTGDVTPTTSTLSTTDDPMHSMFITASSLSDWRSDNNDNRWYADPQENNPCPEGWRVPTEAELNAEHPSWTEGNNAAGAYASTLKWPVGGRRTSTGMLSFVGSHGRVWSSSVSGTNAKGLFFSSSSAFMTNSNRAYGMSVRCVRDN